MKDLHRDPWLTDRVSTALDAIRYADHAGLETELDLIAFAEDVLTHYSEAQVEKPDPQVTFFYTTDRPHQYTTGPTVTDRDYSNGRSEPIPTLERAKELAEEKRSGVPGSESYVQTTYGCKMEIKTEPRIRGKY